MFAVRERKCQPTGWSSESGVGWREGCIGEGGQGGDEEWSKKKERVYT